MSRHSSKWPRSHHLVSPTRCIPSAPRVPLIDLDKGLGQSILPHFVGSFPRGSHVMLNGKGEVTEYKPICSTHLQAPYVISPDLMLKMTQSNLHQALWYPIIPGHAAPDQGGAPADGSLCYLEPGKTVHSSVSMVQLFFQRPEQEILYTLCSLLEHSDT